MAESRVAEERHLGTNGFTFGRENVLHRLEDEERQRLQAQREDEEDDAGIAMPSARQLARDTMRSPAVPDASSMAIIALATTMRRGFWMVLILILLVAIVR